MKRIIFTGTMAACVLFTNCGQKNTSSNSSTPSPKAQTNTSSAPATQQGSAVPAVPPTDAELRQKVAGVWKYSHHFLGVTNEDTFTFAPNGNYAKQSVALHKTETKNFLGLGTWQIKDGVLIATITKADPIPQGAVGDDLRKALANGGFVSRDKIVSVNEHELVIEIDVYTITGTGGHTKGKGTVKWTRQMVAL